MIRGARTLTMLVALALPATVGAATSQLWGDHGEHWSPHGRLPDFSFAGYRGNDASIPDLPRVANVRDFGAIGDGVTDDSAAFLAAVGTGREGVIFIPEGRYRLTKQIRVARRGVVLQGEGTDKSILIFPRSLTDAVGPGEKFAPGGAWSWSGGFLSFEGSNEGSDLAHVVAPAKRGADELVVDSVDHLQVGQAIRLFQTDIDGSLDRRLHADQKNGSELLKGKRLIDFSCKIIAIKRKKIWINRPLRIDIDPKWKPTIAGDSPTVENVGVENLAIEFPDGVYAGHHREPGFNAISFETVENGWVRQVRIENADCGVIFRSGTKFCTVQNLEFTATAGRPSDGHIGHHGVLIADLSQDNRIEGFRIRGSFIHDLCVTSMAAGNVFMSGRGDNLSMDHHRKAPYENLFTDIDLGQGSQSWLAGGDEEAGPHSGARETFWNIRAAVLQSFPDWAVQFNFVGVVTAHLAALASTGNWIEPIRADQLRPSNLFASQLARRKKPPAH